jgi:intracellular multiplication protein IcmG
MVDNEDNNDEYKFTDLDGPDNEMGENHDLEPSGSESVASEKPDVRRNAIIAVVIIVFVMVLYKLIAHMMAEKNDDLTEAAPTPPPIQQIQTEPTPPPVAALPTTPVVTNASQGGAELTKKVSDVEQSQISVRTEVSAIGQQVNTVNNNISQLSNQIAALNQTVTNLTSQLTKQSEELDALKVREKTHQMKRMVHHKSTTKRIMYYVQAIIPGRAWLIGTNGSTLTVREGTKVPGYGVVQLIDSIQGKVVINSGQIIRFSQEDS